MEKIKYRCKGCKGKGKGVCSHARRKYYYKDCKGPGICEHGNRKDRCKECSERKICKECDMDENRARIKCIHGKISENITLEDEILNKINHRVINSETVLSGIIKLDHDTPLSGSIYP